MYNYSPIHKLRVKNFRNIGDVELDFTKSPIITLVGENEAGKTSIIKAFATCALHANPRDQKDYIRDTTKMFGVEIDLQDGTQIVRVKEDGGINLYRVIYPDGKVWDTGKITDGLPVEVSKVMGLIAEPETNEFLHIRTYEDKLLFVVTPNSTNYKVMYNALKVEQLTKAIKLGSTEANNLKSSINNNDVSIQTLGAQLRSISIVDVEPIKNIKDRLIQQMAVLTKLEKAKSLVDKVDSCEQQLGAVALIDRFGLQPIDELMSSRLSNASRLLNNKSELENKSLWVESVNDLAEIDVSVSNKLKYILEKKTELSKKLADAGALVHLSEISEISEIVPIHLTKINSLLNDIRTKEAEIQKIDVTGQEEIQQSSLDSITKLQRIYSFVDSINSKEVELEQDNNYIEQVQDYMKQCGVAVETCPRCGEAVIFDVDKL